MRQMMSRRKASRTSNKLVQLGIHVERAVNRESQCVLDALDMAAKHMESAALNDGVRDLIEKAERKSSNE